MIREFYRPRGYHVGDFDIAEDEESGKFYLYMDADHKGIVTLEMSADLHEAEKEVAWSYPDLRSPFTREGITITDHNGRKYMLTSGMTGYIPNRSDAAEAEKWTDVFCSFGDPSREDSTNSSFNSQLTQIFKIPGKADCYIALADRWVPEYPVDARLAEVLQRVIASYTDPEHYNSTEKEREELANSPILKYAISSIADYVWLPLTFQNGHAVITWKDE